MRQEISSTLALLSVVACLLIGCQGLGVDTKGRKPTDVATLFLDAVKDGDYDKAASFWTSESVKKIIATEGSFQGFCDELWGPFDTVELGKTRKGKEEFYEKQFRGFVDGELTADRYMFFQLDDGTWRLVW